MNADEYRLIVEQHRTEAQRLLAEWAHSPHAGPDESWIEDRSFYIAVAQVHATLAGPAT